MYLINTTFVLTRRIEPDFTAWLGGVYRPAAAATGIFSNMRLARVLNDDDPMTVTLAFEMQCESLSEAKRWHDTSAALLRGDMADRWGENALFFTSYLKIETQGE